MLIYAILYQRRAYPEVIFRKVSMYRTTVFTTIFPPLQTYVKNVLSSALKLLEDDKLRSVCVLFSDEENKSRLLELHTFDLYDIYELLANVQKNYHAFTEYEEKIRACLLTMNAKCKNLVSLPTRFTFSIKLVTTQSGFAKLANDVNQQVLQFLYIFIFKITFLYFYRFFHG